ncbi:MAG: multidrug efflux SMR transporter [Candidatus Sericytochromatia bacterium]|nr:multidrug efflux SMR transporter [Candidatus Sericytochromatia bacterium]
MAWLHLGLAGLLEVAFALCLQASAGFTRPAWVVATAVSGLASFYLLSLALRTLPVGTAYAVWTGIGAAGVAFVGLVVKGEPATPLRLAALTLIVAGVAALRLAGE